MTFLYTSTHLSSTVPLHLYNRKRAAACCLLIYIHIVYILNVLTTVAGCQRPAVATTLRRVVEV